MKRIYIATAVMLIVASPVLGQSKQDKAQRIMALQDATREVSKHIVTCDDLKADPIQLSPISYLIEAQKILGRSADDFDFTKSEYETSNDYKERIIPRVEMLFGPSEKMFFQIPVSENQLSYDADKSLMTVNFGASHSGVLLSSSFKNEYRILSTTEIDSGSENGVTRLGVKFKYDKYAELTRLVGFSTVNMKKFRGNFSYSTQMGTDVRFSITPSEARITKDRLMIIIMGTAVDPYFESYDQITTPSLDHPYQGFLFTQALYINPVCAFLYDTSRKAVIHTYLDDTAT